MKGIISIFCVLSLMFFLPACESASEPPEASGESSMQETHSTTPSIDRKTKQGDELQAEETMTESHSETGDADTSSSDLGTDEAPGSTEEVQDNTMKLQIGEIVWTATLVENSSTEALKELLADGPVTIEMQDYGNMEKVGGFGTSLPTNDEQITTEPGDLILYQGNAFVIYYEPNSWNFTRLGKINDVTQAELIEVLGSGNVTVTLSLD